MSEAEQIVNNELPRSLVAAGFSLQETDINDQCRQEGIIPLGPKRWTHNLAAYKSTELDRKELAPPPFIVEKLLPAGLCIFAAPRKTGKSWACLQLCHCVATGEPFLGFTTNRGSCLYLDLEGRDYRIKGRFDAMAYDKSENIYIAHDAETTDNGLIAQLEQWRDSVPNASLIIIDVVQKVKGRANRGENAYETDYRLYGPLQKFAMEHGLALVAITHIGKQKLPLNNEYDAVIGSTGSTGTADTIWVLNKDKEDEFRLSAIGRDIEEVRLQLKLGKNPVQWENLGDCEALEEQRALASYRNNPIVKTIRNAVKDGGVFEGTASEILLRVAHETKEYPCDSGKEGRARVFSNQLKALAPLLLKNDGIVYIPPTYGNARGRRHVFRTQGFVG